MASVKEMRTRISSVKSTQKITKALQMVAAAKLRRAQLAAEAAHGSVLFPRVANRYDDQRLHAQGTRCHGQALTMIAPGGGDDALNLGPCAFEPVQKGDTAADLESTGRGMVFMLDPDRTAQARAEQRPGILRGGGHHSIHVACRVFKVFQGRTGHGAGLQGFAAV